MSYVLYRSRFIGSMNLNSIVSDKFRCLLVCYVLLVGVGSGLRPVLIASAYEVPPLRILAVSCLFLRQGELSFSNTYRRLNHSKTFNALPTSRSFPMQNITSPCHQIGMS